MDITTVQLLHEDYTIYTNKDVYIRVDASTVEKVTSPAIQLLVSLNKTTSQNHNRLIVEKQSSAFTEAFRDFGLTSLLQRWSNET